MEQVKQAINEMLSGYQQVKALHYFYSSDNKHDVIINMINQSIELINPLISNVQPITDIPFNIVSDLIAYENWLIDLSVGYTVDMAVNDIVFKCRYELPQSGYDCVYLDYETDNPFLCLI